MVPPLLPLPLVPTTVGEVGWGGSGGGVPSRFQERQRESFEAKAKKEKERADSKQKSDRDNQSNVERR